MYNYVLLNSDNICINFLSTPHEGIVLEKNQETDRIIELSDPNIDLWSVLYKKYENGIFVALPVEEPVVIPKTLDDLKAIKIAELTQSRDTELGQFTSSALGTPNTYLADEKSMIYLSDEANFVRSIDYDGKPTSWYTVQEGFVDHTADQIVQVHRDGRTHVRVLAMKLYQLITQAQVAVSEDELHWIVW